MESRSWGVRIGELSTLIYLIFPILAIFVDKRGNFLTYLIVCTIFIISYVTMILFYKYLSNSILYSLLVIHYLGIFYFVYSVNPMNSLFFFYSAFALPFIFNVRVVSKEFITFLIAMVSCLILTYIFNPTFVVLLSAFYLVILIVAIGNFKNRDERIMKAKLEEKNKYINVLIAQQERNRISQDLHDTLGHVFASLTLKSELAVKLIDTNPKEAKNEMQAINQLSTEALN
ncbi:MAG: histidine kinase, partial [Staphylococcus epidermidis]|nr:histidine kinase [Staphylococcus epidermidis]